MVYLIDTNIIIRFLVGNDEEFLLQSTEIFQNIENGTVQVEILSEALMECYFVLTKFYKLPKNEVINDLKTILSLQGVVNQDKIILLETLNLIENKHIDFADVLICAKTKLQNYKSFRYFFISKKTKTDHF